MLKICRRVQYWRSQPWCACSRPLSYPNTPLTQPVSDPGFSNKEIPARRPTHVANSPTRISTLDNGLRVATHSAFGQYCTVGVFVDAGSRYEVLGPSGVTHFLSKMALQSTSRFENNAAIMAELEKCGGFPDQQMFRDLMMYCVSAYSFSAAKAVEVLAEVVWRPLFKEEELEAAKQSIAAELESMEMQPVPELLLTELIHQAAYRNNTLGLPNLCPSEDITRMTTNDLWKFYSTYMKPSRMVLVGVNVEHEELVELAQQHFVSPDTSWEGKGDIEVDTSISQYTGGEVKLVRGGPPVVGPNPLPELTHISVAMESSSYANKKDFFPLAVLNSLMGGGGSFSAGGPGKGMYTQLYLNVLNREPWVYHAQAVNHAYSDSGIFTIFGSAHPSQGKQLAELLCHQFHEMTLPPKEDDLARAKRQLQSTLMMNLESRIITFEDIGRQVLAQNERIPPDELCRIIEGVSVDDIVRVATNMKERSLLSMASLGDLTLVPSVREVEDSLTSPQSSNRSRWSLFR